MGGRTWTQKGLVTVATSTVTRHFRQRTWRQKPAVGFTGLHNHHFHLCTRTLATVQPPRGSQNKLARSPAAGLAFAGRPRDSASRWKCSWIAEPMLQSAASEALPKLRDPDPGLWHMANSIHGKFEGQRYQRSCLLKKQVDFCLQKMLCYLRKWWIFYMSMDFSVFSYWFQTFSPKQRDHTELQWPCANAAASPPQWLQPASWWPRPCAPRTRPPWSRERTAASWDLPLHLRLKTMEKNMLMVTKIIWMWNTWETWGKSAVETNFGMLGIQSVTSCTLDPWNRTSALARACVEEQHFVGVGEDCIQWCTWKTGQHFWSKHS